MADMRTINQGCIFCKARTRCRASIFSFFYKRITNLKRNMLRYNIKIQPNLETKKDIKLKKFLILLLFILFSFYAPKKKIEIAPQVVEYRTKEKEADILLKKGSYACLKEAFQIYHDLLSEPQTQEQAKEKLIKTGLLLTLREKELGF